MKPYLLDPRQVPSVLQIPRRAPGGAAGLHDFTLTLSYTQGIRTFSSLLPGDGHARSIRFWMFYDVFELLRTDTGAEGDMTDSGYPSQVREWRRGSNLNDAPLVFKGEKTDSRALVSTSFRLRRVVCFVWNRPRMS